MKIWSLVLALAVGLASMNADAARRLGGGKSVGQQSNNVTQREAARAPANPQGAAAPAQAAQPAAAPHAQPQAAAPKKPWGAMLGGLAAGLGLAWLAHSLGLGEAFGQFLMFALLALVLMAVVGYFLRSRQKGSQAPAASGPFALQGAGAGGGGVAERAGMPRSYKPENVGNDASARPWERSTFDGARFQAATAGQGGSMIGAALRGSEQSWGIPADFDTAGFLEAAKRNFVTLQDAWDRSDITTLRAMMTDDMVGEIRTQLSEREGHTGAQPNKTEVVFLDAQLLGIEDLDNAYLASVEFSGMIREEPSAGPSAFREVWNMTKPKDGRSGWLVAGVQALQ